MSKRFEKASAYPLSWPELFPVTKSQIKSKFSTTLAAALDNVESALSKLASDSGKKLTNIIISSNYSMSDRRPKESGVSVWFEWDGDIGCYPVDQYNKVECNVQAIYHMIEADRTKIRHGGLHLVKAAYRGTLELPDPSKRSWRDILGDCKKLGEAKQVYRQKISAAHPDKLGGSAALASELNKAMADAEQHFNQGEA